LTRQCDCITLEIAFNLSVPEVAMATPSTPCSESTLTDRYQTTVPDPIRKVLGLNKRDRISYTIGSDGQVTIARAEDENNDPLLGQFLNFLATDIQANPQHVRQVSSDLVDRIRSLVDNVDLDLDAPLAAEDE
jgi:antitoxin PrlF